MMLALDGPIGAPPAHDAAYANVREVGRFLLTGGDPGVADYYFRALYVPHATRSRLARRALGALPATVRRPILARTVGRPVRYTHSTRRAAPRTEPAPASGAATGLADSRRRQIELLRRVLDDVDSLLCGTVLEGWPADRWIALRDYDRGNRGRVLVFPFEAAADRPTAVLKIRPARRPGRSLETEWRALHAVAAVATGSGFDAPAPLAYRVRDGIEMLLMSMVPGRSIDVDLRAGPRSARRTEEHFTRAADWLGRFHAATRRPDLDGRLRPDDRALALRRLATPGESVRGTLLRLEALTDTVPVAAVHGDFWARNTLLADEGGLGVVDWERYRPAAPCFVDLFHFPITYAVAYASARGRTVDPVTAFRSAFLEDGILARAVRSYLDRYCTRTGLDRAALRPLLALHLLTVGSPGDATADQDPWAVCQHLLARAPRPPSLP